jgi:hypothetical protein
VAEPEDPPAEAGGREGEFSTSVDTDQPESDSAESAEHDTDDDSLGKSPDDSHEDDTDDKPDGHDAAEDANDSSEDETADDESGDDEDDEDASPKRLPPLEPAPYIELMAAYRQPATAGGERLPWSWATLSPAERATSATLLDGFVKSYNRTWAISKQQTVPPCWHRHPALAHDLATLAWVYYQAYRDPTATPDRALQFQAALLPFAKRMNRWLGSKPGECRAGQHAASWRDADGISGAARRSTTEDTDAVTLLGEETFGFVQPTPPTTE